MGGRGLSGVRQRVRRHIDPLEKLLGVAGGRKKSVLAPRTSRRFVQTEKWKKNDSNTCRVIRTYAPCFHSFTFLTPRDALDIGISLVLKKQDKSLFILRRRESPNYKALCGFHQEWHAQLRLQLQSRGTQCHWQCSARLVCTRNTFDTAFFNNCRTKS